MTAPAQYTAAFAAADTCAPAAVDGSARTAAPVSASERPESRRRTLWVGEIAATLDEAYLFHAFSQEGDVTNVKLVRDRTTMKPVFAFVEFAQHEVPERLHTEQIKGRPFVDKNGNRFKLGWALYGLAGGQHKAVMLDGDTSIYVGSLDADVTDGQLYNVFASRYDSVISAKVITESTSNFCKGFGFVRFREPAQAEQAVLEMDGHTFRRRPLKVRRSFKKPSDLIPEHKSPNHLVCPMYSPQDGCMWTPPAMQENVPAVQPVTGDVKTPIGYTGHVLNLSGVGWHVTEADIVHYFSNFGPVLQACIARGHEGFASVEFRNRDSLDVAVQHVGVAGSSLPFQVRGISAEEFLSWPPQLPKITNMTTQQAQSELELQMQAPAFDDTAVAQAAEAWSAGLFGGGKGTSLPPALANFQALLQNPIFAQAFEEKFSPFGAVAAGGDATRGAPGFVNTGDCDGELWSNPSWLLQDHPELFTGAPCGKLMNQDYLPRLNSPRRCCDGWAASTALLAEGVELFNSGGSIAGDTAGDPTNTPIAAA